MESLYESSSNNVLNDAGAATIIFLASSVQDSQAETGTSWAVLYWALTIEEKKKVPNSATRSLFLWSFEKTGNFSKEIK